jgi:hypothetical protein
MSEGMSDGQLVFLFCVIYSGALSVVVWANLVARQALRAHLREPDLRGEFPAKLRRGA